MPTTREFTIRMEDKPGTLGKVCRILADRGINILGFQSIPSEGRSLVRFVTDNAVLTQTTLESERLSFTESPIAQVKLPHRAGELARAAGKLGEARININHAYCGMESGTNTPLLFFGVTDAAQAAKVLDQAAASASAKA